MQPRRVEGSSTENSYIRSSSLPLIPYSSTAMRRTDGAAVAEPRSSMVAYGLVAMAAAALNNVYLVYYVTLFQAAGLSRPAFVLGQGLYMMWNSVNDPLFGWALDSARFGLQPAPRRLALLRWAGVGWAVALLLMFVPWGPAVGAGVFAQYLLSLVLYDGFLSLVMILHNALLADLFVLEADRVRCNSWASSLSVAGSCSVLLSHRFWDPAAPYLFVPYVAVVCAMSAVLFAAGAQWLMPAARRAEGRRADLRKAEAPGARDAAPAFWTLVRQLAARRSARVLVAVVFVQVFHCHFMSNSLPLFVDRTLDADSHYSKMAVVASSSLIPHALVVLCAPLVERYSVYALVRALLWLKVAFVAALYVLADHVAAVALYAVLAKSFSEVICRHWGLVIAQLVDEDQVLERRPASLASSIQGAVALFTKSAQSVAPVLIAYLYWRPPAVEEVGAVVGREAAPTVSVDAAATASEFFLFSYGAVAVGCGVVQLALWHVFPLRGEYLEKVQERKLRMVVLQSETEAAERSERL